MVWLCTPSLQLFRIVLQSVRTFYLTIIHTFLAPLYDAAAFTFGRINVTINHSTKNERESNKTSNLYPSIQHFSSKVDDKVCLI